MLQIRIQIFNTANMKAHHCTVHDHKTATATSYPESSVRCDPHE